MACVLPLVFFLGCADDRPPLAMHLPETDGPVTNNAVTTQEVLGTQSGEQNRSTINSTDQQIYNQEHADSGSPSHPTAPNTGIP
jgi:hypothetical protein